jgi:hypothetical protein
MGLITWIAFTQVTQHYQQSWIEDFSVIFYLNFTGQRRANYNQLCVACVDDDTSV